MEEPERAFGGDHEHASQPSGGQGLQQLHGPFFGIWDLDETRLRRYVKAHASGTGGKPLGVSG